MIQRTGDHRSRDWGSGPVGTMSVAGRPRYVGAVPVVMVEDKPQRPSVGFDPRSKRGRKPA